jgi:membrane carboxypeptidase/penicillin-binding protein
VISPTVADGVNYVLHQVMEPGGTGGKLKFGKSDLAGKTGTTQENKSVWFAGYSSKLAAASVVADATPKYTNMIGQTLNGKEMRDASGSGTAGPIWETAMQLALQGLPTSKFVQPDRVTIRGNVVDLPDLKGMTPVDAAAKLLSMGFKAAVDPTPVDSDAPAGTVAYTRPRQEDGAPAGATITLFLSNGSQAIPTPPPTVPPPPGIPPTIKPPPNFPSCPPWNPKFPNCGGR